MKINDVSLRRISAEEGVQFLAYHGGYVELDFSKSVVFIGLFENRVLSGVGAFGSPREDALRERYTTKVFALKSVYPSEYDQAFEEIISYYKDSFSPADLVFDSEVAPSLSAALQAGFSLSEEIFLSETFEWFNPEVTFYVYKTTSPLSSKYYFGVKQINISDASEEECLKDPYFGSGRRGDKKNKFHNWQSKYRDSLQKEIIEIFSSKAKAYAHERETIGNLWKTDPNCLNSIAGGSHGGLGLRQDRIANRKCEKHGLAKHIGTKCYSCISEAMNLTTFCEKHGMVSHRGSLCLTCMRENRASLKLCDRHGLSRHYGEQCCHCHTENQVSVKDCNKHGARKHIGSKCYVCINEESISDKKCSKHGVTKHRGKSCQKCHSEKSISLKSCERHEETKHRGDTCLRCAHEKSISMKKCPEHGVVKHMGSACKTCSAVKIAHNRHHSKKTKVGCPHCAVT